MKAVRLSVGVMVGFSMGSAIALSLAMQYRKRVLGPGLVGGGAKIGWLRPPLRWLPIHPLFLRLFETIIENSYSPTANPRLKELAVEQMTETRQAVLYGDFLACDSFDVMESVKKIQVSHSPDLRQ